jgi:uncharacterized membrane protein
MGWTPLAVLGRLAWPVLGSLLPGLSPRLMMVLAGVLVVLVAIGGPAGVVWLSMRGELNRAVAAAAQARDLHWQTEITKANQTHAQALAAARQAADAVAATPDDRAERLLICRQSPTCRDRGR